MTQKHKQPSVSVKQVKLQIPLVYGLRESKGNPISGWLALSNEADALWIIGKENSASSVPL